MSDRTYYIVRKRSLFSGYLFCSLQKNKEWFTEKCLLRIHLEIACQLITQIRTSKLPCGFLDDHHMPCISLVLWVQQRSKRSTFHSKEVVNLVVEQKTPRILHLLYLVPIGSYTYVF